MFYEDYGVGVVVRPTYEDYTLILPSVSVGNVGQLTVDLLLSTLPVKRIGYFYTHLLQPIIGYSDENFQNIVTACEAYEVDHDVHKLIIIQQRGLCVKGKTRQFANRLIEWITSKRFKEVILVSSSFAHLRTGEQLSRSLFNYICSSSVQNQEALSELLGWTRWENTTEDVKIEGGGVSTYFLKKCDELQIPLVVLVQLCDEGDNRRDAYLLAKSLNFKLNLVQEGAVLEAMWVSPPSWSIPFGSNQVPELY